MIDALPQAQGLEVGALSRVFEHTTNSYKHLFLAAILTSFKQSGFETTRFSLNDLSIGMLTAAWHPCRLFRLSFGARDQVARILAEVPLPTDGPIPFAILRSSLAERAPDCRELLRWVPFRLLTPFFSDLMAGLPDGRRNSFIRSQAEQRFDEIRPLYRFVGSDAIQIHPDWAAYIAANMPIVEGWAERHWIAYLQANNATVPAISAKVRPPIARRSLIAQKAYWRTALTAMQNLPKCIYTGLEINPATFHLDHFLPWTFVCHDAVWNLIPTFQDTNSSKGNRLPAPEYLAPMVDLQLSGLIAARRILKDREWRVATASFISDLRMSEDNLFNRDALAAAYDHSVRPQFDIARGIGFAWGWRPI